MMNQKKRCLQWCLGAVLAQFVLGSALAADFSQVTNCVDIVKLKISDARMAWQQHGMSDPLDNIDIMCPVGSFIVDSAHDDLAKSICSAMGGSPNGSIPYSDMGDANTGEHRPIVHCSSVPGMNGNRQDLSIQIQCHNKTKAFTADEDAQSIKCNN